MWAWVGTAAAASYAMRMETVAAESLGKLTAFLAIGLGAFVCVPAGWMGDRAGKAEVTILAMLASGSAAALLTAATFGGPVWLTFVLVIVWGLAVIPDSAQFSAIVADAAPPHLAGSLLTFQTALRLRAHHRDGAGHAAGGGRLWLAGGACRACLGPAAGVVAMLPLRRADRCGGPALRGGTLWTRPRGRLM